MGPDYDTRVAQHYGYTTSPRGAFGNAEMTRSLLTRENHAPADRFGKWWHELAGTGVVALVGLTLLTLVDMHNRAGMREAEPTALMSDQATEPVSKLAKR